MPSNYTEIDLIIKKFTFFDKQEALEIQFLLLIK